jgi:hypothetical protein
VKAPSVDALLAQAALLSVPDRRRLVQALLAGLPGTTPSPPAATPPPEWSRPNTLVSWAQLFRCSRGTMARWFDSGTIRGRRLGSRWQVAMEHMPANR